MFALMAGCAENVCRPECSPGRNLGCDLDGRPITTGSYPGRVLAVNFWACWCRPCALQLAALDSLQADYGDRVKVIAVNCDRDRAVVRRFLDNHPVSILITLDPAGTVVRSLGVITIPTDVVVDKGGSVYPVTVGYHPGLSAMRAKIDSLLASPDH
jgi:thiol-disulfide isomerase/thioredoxin